MCVSYHLTTSKTIMLVLPIVRNPKSMSLDWSPMCITSTPNFIKVRLAVIEYVLCVQTEKANLTGALHEYCEHTYKRREVEKYLMLSQLYKKVNLTVPRPCLRLMYVCPPDNI
jgi:hypothetical protein